MWRFILVSLLTLGSLAAQFLPNRLPPGVVSYLEITETQQQQIVQANLALQNFSMQKMRRSSQVQSEIAMETARPDLDPMALGMRYRELEAIRREIATERTRAVETVQAILTTAQKQKLTVLQEALRLQSTACDAVNWNLMPYPLRVPFAPSPWIETGSFSSVLLTTMMPSAGTCGVTGGMRNGDFTFNPMMP